ncbi:MAG: hypothetical protein V4720_15590 [Pseudomonadota bacterium]
MPKLVRLYIESVAVGLAISAAFTGALLWLDVGGLGHLVMASDIGWVAVMMLVMFNGIVFAAVQFAVRIMGMADSDDGTRGGHGAREPVLIPVPVPVRNRRR